MAAGGGWGLGLKDQRVPTAPCIVLVSSAWPLSIYKTVAGSWSLQAEADLVSKIVTCSSQGFEFSVPIEEAVTELNK